MPTAAQRKNLLKLAAYLESLPEDYEHFGMRFYAMHQGACNLPMPEDVYAAKKPAAFLSNCGTVACAVGHGPAAGIRPKPEEFFGESDTGAVDFYWAGYAKRAFGTPTLSREFNFLFGSQWVRVDNHHYGAAARIRCFLATGNTLDPDERSARRKYAPFRKGSRSAVRREIEQVSA